MDKKTISRDGYESLVHELKQLRETDRPEILKVVRWARSLGDLSENADYFAAKEKQRQIDKRIAVISDILEHANVVDVGNLSGNRVMFGARVVAEDEDGNKMQCRILSDIESDGKQIISCTSPVGRRLIGKCVGDTCVVNLPGGSKEYEILEVKFKE